ncbi:RDD family protein [Microbispora hainanensis]|uniref:RDD family protein n=1 Tax=Microbispora hainanensis TaxID=568844 RepID=A0A544Z3M7_9ACTN|nr:RDD family protein [Microbispora hainanensis]TQS23628.1 RDD family protein [Microbispora hainanensis]
MSDRQPRWTQTWMDGPRAAGANLGYPGERLGLPEQGPGAVAGWGRRIGAVAVDWLLCTWAIAGGLLRVQGNDVGVVGLGVFAAEYVLLVSTIGMTLGMRLFGIRVARLDGGRPQFPGVLVRTLLLCLAVPALIWDRDRRGLHDRASGTVVVNL